MDDIIKCILAFIATIGIFLAIGLLYEIVELLKKIYKKLGTSK